VAVEGDLVGVAKTVVLSSAVILWRVRVVMTGDVDAMVKK
jgi:hypothetical protein